ncbi:MAG TPA: hypothetical protein VKR31_14485 [Rhizomicrobium sp.]|nr:hypothetical protein [Rhizomicrobium sp.]
MAMTAGGAHFAPRATRDRDFFLFMVALIWLGILMGFVPDIAAHLRMHKPAYPLIVHVHAAAFVGWLCLLTTQVVLIRSGRADIHRKLGVFGAILATAMVFLGLATSVVVDRLHFRTPDSDPQFLAIQLADILNFGTLAAAAIVWRKTPSAHKRLILLATIFIADAGFARWLGDSVAKVVGSGFWQDWTSFYVYDLVLVIIIGAYDLLTRRRLHPAFVAGSIFGIGVQVIAAWLYVSPWWKLASLRLLGL